MAIGRYPTFMAWAARHAAIEVGRSFSRDRPPETAVNAAASSGTQDMTSRITSGRSTRGSMAVVRLRRSTSDGGSSIAFTPVRWIFPASSTRTSVLTASLPADLPVGGVQRLGVLGEQRVGSSGRPSVVSTSARIACHASPSRSPAWGLRHRVEAPA